MTPWVFQGPLTPLHNNMSIREALKDSQRSKEVAYSLWCPILRASAERILLSLQRHMSAVKSEESRSTYSNVRTSEYCYRCFLCRCSLLTATPLTSPNEVPRPKLCQDCDMAVNTLVNTWHDSIANHLGSPLLSSTSFPLSSPRTSTHISLISLRGFLIASSTDREMVKTRIVRDKVLVEGILQNDLQRSVQFANSVYRRSVCPASDTIFTDNMEFIARYLLDFSRGTALEPNPIAILEIDTSHRYTEDPFESNIVVENVNQHILSSPFDTSLATALGQCLAYLAQSVVLEWISSIACKCHANSTTTQRRLESSEKLGEIIHYYVRSEVDVICGLNCDILTVGHLYSLPSSNFDYLACDFVLSLFEFVATEALYLSTKGNTTLDSSRGVFAPCTVTDLENQQELQASIPGQTGKCEGNNGIKHIRVVTGCPCIDSIVGNVGFPLGQLSEIYGEAGSGKTQIGIATLAHTVAQGIVLSDIHSKDPKSCSSSVSAIYFVAEDLPQCRLKEFATGAARDMLMRESDCSGNEDSVETISTIILQNIFIRKIIDLDHFIEILKDSNGTGLIRFIQDKNVKVIVVDSIAAAAQSTASSLSNPKRCRDDLYNVKENVCFTNFAFDSN